MNLYFTLPTSINLNLEHHDERFYCEEYPTGEVPVDPPLGRPMRQDEVIGLPHIEAKVING